MSLGGPEYHLAHGDYTADITGVGGGLRTLRDAGRDLIVPYAADEIRPLYRGALLAPWPNRVVDGRYAFGGVDHQLPVNEAGRHHALHGLVSWQRFDLVDHRSDAVTLAHRTVPQPGYPFALELSVEYRLDEHGLRCSVHTTNVGGAAAPYGVGTHPYLLGGPGRVDDWVLRLPADEVLEVSPERLLPLARSRVDDTGLDFRSTRRIADTEVDHAFTALSPDDDGLVRVRLQTTREDTMATGGVVCEWDPAALPWVQVHTADLADPEASRQGLAVEPMSCPPDAFNSGTDLVVLEPGDTHACWWTIRRA